MDQTPPCRDSWNDRLSEYLDDDLDARERAALEAHLAACEACRVDLDALRAVVSRAQRLVDAPPASDPWPGIASAIARHPQTVVTPARRFSFTLPQLVAAGLAIMVLSGGMVWLARLGGQRTDFPPVDAQSTARPGTFGDAAYTDAIADLEKTLEDARTRLDPDTVRVLDQNLRAIDRAIAQCREALAADPDNAYLNTYLAQARTRKLDLLRHAAAVAGREAAGPRS
jgi:hypothetical protein